MNTDHARIAAKQWQFAQTWAERLSDRQLATVLRLKVPGEAGFAATQEAARRQS